MKTERKKIQRVKIEGLLQYGYAKEIAQRMKCSVRKVYAVRNGESNDVRIENEILKLIAELRRIREENELLKKQTAIDRLPVNEVA